ncbi:hypothetical protein PPERSA_12400 [Pseudocohnilembus persalinus]|uniref:Uncharacterized protein n=1 Tax=Pseudocohnilembus persalinus TaxID=266149 RepID=A0A0V0QP99_PSEPJ|nr:hypothetical protein PPERSA_12400 [Pseudocohnilembus persalinus]|eukprot:KRX03953.1 hypothetical protein PPERSA_12400 [Pseudocohnilembus persalinus]
MSDHQKLKIEKLTNVALPAVYTIFSTLQGFYSQELNFKGGQLASDSQLSSIEKQQFQLVQIFSMLSLISILISYGIVVVVYFVIFFGEGIFYSVQNSTPKLFYVNYKFIFTISFILSLNFRPEE